MAVNLDAIRRRFEASTPGIWKTGNKFGNGALGPAVAVISGKLPPIELDPRRNGRADAAFIAHAHQDVPALLAEVDQLRAAVALVRRLNKPMQDQLRRAAADTSSNWDVTATVYPPSAQGLVALIDALNAVDHDPVPA